MISHNHAAPFASWSALWKWNFARWMMVVASVAQRKASTPGIVTRAFAHAFSRALRNASGTAHQ